MAELTIDAAEIAAALRKHVESFKPTTTQAQVGRVLEVGDGIARVAGLPETAVNELLEFEGGSLGLALNLDEDSIGAVVLGGAQNVEEGHTVQATGRILSVPVGDALIGRVVSLHAALGRPDDCRHVRAEFGRKSPITLRFESRRGISGRGQCASGHSPPPVGSGSDCSDRMSCSVMSLMVPATAGPKTLLGIRDE